MKAFMHSNINIYVIQQVQSHVEIKTLLTCLQLMFTITVHVRRHIYNTSFALVLGAHLDKDVCRTLIWSFRMVGSARSGGSSAWVQQVLGKL